LDSFQSSEIWADLGPAGSTMVARLKVPFNGLNGILSKMRELLVSEKI
jgi:hypothetical protein